MREVGIRELKQHTSEIVRRVREEKETVLLNLEHTSKPRLKSMS
jgi:antitoxin (DNA-binding transcriptional repressor) of toxin-antitoxin stability system